jgi:hypothetical protein
MGSTIPSNTTPSNYNASPENSAQPSEEEGR